MTTGRATRREDDDEDSEFAPRPVKSVADARSEKGEKSEKEMMLGGAGRSAA